LLFEFPHAGFSGDTGFLLDDAGFPLCNAGLTLCDQGILFGDAVIPFSDPGIQGFVDHQEVLA
jgi:hypothetical protein